MSYETIAVETKNDVAWCKLNRPEVRNAFNSQMIEELTAFAANLPEGIRAVVLHGEGQAFCAGGDLRWMQNSLDLTREQNLQDAKKLAAMNFALDRLPVPVLGMIHGVAMGGGAGLVCICDYVIAVQGTLFSFSEVRLGIVPACIAPFVIRKIGPGHARSLFTTAERFETQKAFQIGMVHQIAEHLESAEELTQKKLHEIAQCGPNAVKAAKGLIFDLLFASSDEAQLNMAAELLASVRVSEEGQEGLRAFLEKRKPNWIKH